jgi:hypothetical protein
MMKMEQYRTFASCSAGFRCVAAVSAVAPVAGVAAVVVE